MRRYIDCVLAILPFEPAAHLRLGGPPCVYVGHPMIERVAELRPNADEAKRRRSDPPLVLVLPGSRSSEIRRLLATFGAAIARVAARAGRWSWCCRPCRILLARVRDGVAGWPVQPRIVVEPAEKWAAFRAARAALAASGTVTLELALAGVPTVAAYRVSLIEEIVARLCGCARDCTRHSRQSGDRRKRRAGISAARLHAGKSGGCAGSAVVRNAGAAAPGRRASSGSMPSWAIGTRERRARGRRHRARYGPARPPRSGGRRRSGAHVNRPPSAAPLYQCARASC